MKAAEGYIPHAQRMQHAIGMHEKRRYEMYLNTTCSRQTLGIVALGEARF